MNFLYVSLLTIAPNLLLLFSTSTEKSTTKNITKNKAGLKATVKTKVSQCYDTFEGYYENKFYNASQYVLCANNCYSYREKDGSETFQKGSCSEDSDCIGPIFITGYNYSFIYDCCMSNLCNTPEFDANLKMKCENNKPVPKNKKLIFPVRKLNMPSVKQCYYCQKCTSPSSASVVNCVERNNTITNFACQHSFINNGKNQYWSGDCISVEDMLQASYSKLKAKEVSCQTELCNSPANVKKLERATLCLEGFYG